MESGSKNVETKNNESILKNKILIHCFVVLIYGIFLEIVLAFIMNRQINIYNPIPIGIAWHFIKYELPSVVCKYTGGN